MRFWFVHSREVPIRDQIITQITMGILSQELSAGERLPSTRELARRFHLHANTVSAAYQQLETDGWVESRHGSGVFIRPLRPELQAGLEKGSSALGLPNRAQAMEYLLTGLVQSAQHLGISRAALRTYLREWLETQPPNRLLVIDPNPVVRRIIITEIEAALGRPCPVSVMSCSLEDSGLNEILVGALVLALPSKAQGVRAAMPKGVEVMTLEVRSATSALAKMLPAPTDRLVGIISPWAQFREVARVMLVAAGFNLDSMIIRDCSEAGWRKGLSTAAAVVCDSYTATQLPADVRTLPFNLLAEESLAALQHHAQGTGLV